MAVVQAFGITNGGYQRLAPFPNGFKRVFVKLADEDQEIPVLQGTIIVAQEYAPSYNNAYTYRYMKLWGAQLVIQDLPTMPEGSNARWVVAAQWRRAALDWDVYIDDAV